MQTPLFLARSVALGSIGYFVVVVCLLGNDATAMQGAVSFALLSMFYFARVSMQIRSVTSVLKAAISADFTNQIAANPIGIDGMGPLIETSRNLLQTLREELQLDRIDWETVRAQRTASRRLEALVENLPVGVLSTDSSHRISFLNPEMRRLFGIAELVEPNSG